MLRGTLLAESLRLDAELSVPGVLATCVVRRDVKASVTATQPSVWTFIEFEADDSLAEPLRRALEAALEPTGGWYADFTVGSDHVVVFAGRSFRYARGDLAGRAEATAYGRSVGVPEHQLDWAD
ncbi:MAG: hypothetical protein WAM30_20820 [Candidatus Dormiibacterota bacterium]